MYEPKKYHYVVAIAEEENTPQHIYANSPQEAVEIFIDRYGSDYGLDEFAAILGVVPASQVYMFNWDYTQVEKTTTVLREVEETTLVNELTLNPAGKGA